jgi:hypothetical protein
LKKYFIGAIALALLVSAVWPAESQADTIRKSITPLLKTSARYDSNFFKTDTNKEKVYTFLAQPGIEAAVETERSHLSLYYTLDAYFYDDDINEDLDFIGHTLRFDAGTASRSKNLKFRLKDDYNRSRDPSYTDNLTTSVNRAEYGINMFNPEVQYLFGNAVLGLGYKNVLINYDGGDNLTGEDSKQNRGIGKIDYNLDRRNSLGAQFDYWQMDYDDQSIDYDAWQALATYTRSGKYFILEGGAGWQGREFDSQLDDIDDYLWYVALGGTKGGSRFNARADSNFNADGQGDNYYRTTKLALKFEHTLDNSKLKLGLNGSIQNSDYEFSGRDDDIYAIEGSADYPLTSWLTLSGKAGYEDSDSNVDGADYNNTYGMVMFKFIKPIGSGSPVISK